MQSPKPDIIRSVRVRAGLTQKQCCDILDLARVNSWAIYERGYYSSGKPARMPEKKWRVFLDYLKSTGLSCNIT